MRTAEVLARGRDNNFNLIRMVAASAVIVSHSFPLANGEGTWEPFQNWSWAPHTLGGSAVQVFFVVSGFFVMKSFDRRPLATFLTARMARLLPGLIVASLLTSLLVRWVRFADNPLPNLANGAIWTLWYEAVCYVGLTVAGLCGLYRNGRFPAFLLCFGMVYLAIQSELLMLGPNEILSKAYAFLGLPFVLGMAAYEYRRFLPLSGFISAGLWVLAFALPVEATWSLALGYSALWLGSIPSPLTAYNRLGDYSYGTYIYGWPVQQALAATIVGIGPFAMMAMALPIAWLLGVVSWYLIEHPAMRLVRNPQHAVEPVCRLSSTRVGYEDNQGVRSGG